MRKSHHPIAQARAPSSSKSAPSHTSAAMKSSQSKDGVKRNGARHKSLLHNGERIAVIGRAHFLVKSGSAKAEWHCVDLGYVNEDWPDGGCTCDGFSARRTCRHFRVVLDLLGIPDLGPMEADLT